MTQMLTVLAILLASPFGGFAQSDTRPPNEPRLLSKPAAEYPDDAVEGNVAGEVVVEVEVDRKGKVKKARPFGGPRRYKRPQPRPRARPGSSPPPSPVNP